MKLLPGYSPLWDYLRRLPKELFFEFLTAFGILSVYRKRRTNRSEFAGGYWARDQRGRWEYRVPNGPNWNPPAH